MDMDMVNYMLLSDHVTYLWIGRFDLKQQIFMILQEKIYIIIKRLFKFINIKKCQSVKLLLHIFFSDY